MRGTIWILAFMLAACSSTPLQNTLDRVQVGMGKHEVLELAGNPKHTFREHGEDHWIYIYFENDRELSREITFESGKVEKISRAKAKTNWDKELEAMPAQNSDAGFKDVSGP